MIFPKQNFKSHFSNSSFWSSDFESVEKIIKKRKYKISKKGDKISIERKTFDIFDTIGFGFEHLKKLGIASGNLEKENGLTKIEFHVELKSSYKNIIIISFPIYIILFIYILYYDWIMGVATGVFLILGLIWSALIFRFGVNQFVEDLKDDISYFY